MPGCYDNCAHNKPVKVEEMREHYAFRCAALKRYMKREDVKFRCTLFSLPYSFTQPSIEDFFND